MTKEEILQKAIEKAIKNGWKWYPNIMTFQNTRDGIIWVNTAKNVNDILFDLSFAKAFWGEEALEEYPNNYHFATEPRPKRLVKNGWRYHLKQMVLEEDPIKYLEQFLDN